MKLLKESDLILGGKYTPHSKHGKAISNSGVWEHCQKTGQNFLFYNGKTPDGSLRMGRYYPDEGCDWFSISDLVAYLEQEDAPDQAKLLPFNLEEALKDPARVVYRNGEKPLEWHWLRWVKENKEPIVSVGKNGTAMQHYIGGGFYSNIKSDNDLLLLPLPEKTYWINVFKSSSGSFVSSNPIASEQAANDHITSCRGIMTYIKTITITI